MHRFLYKIYIWVTNSFANTKKWQALKVMQRAMERAMNGVTLRDKIHNDEILKKTGDSDVIGKIAKLE